MKFAINVVSKKIFDPNFFLSGIVDVQGMKTIFKVGGAGPNILSNVSEMIDASVFA